MDKKWYKFYSEMSQTDWWYVTRREIIKKLIKIYNTYSKGFILDIGCAEGTLSYEIKKQTNYTPIAMDISHDALISTILLLYKWMPLI